MSLCQTLGYRIDLIPITGIVHRDSFVIFPYNTASPHDASESSSLALADVLPKVTSYPNLVTSPKSPAFTLHDSIVVSLSVYNGVSSIAYTFRLVESFVQSVNSTSALFRLKFVAPFDVVLDADYPEPENIVQPDLMFVAKERMDIITDDNIQGSPDLVIEVLSESTARYDRVGKMSVYAEFGVKWYWILDANACFLESFDLTGEHPQLIASLGGEDVFKPEFLPNLEISLANLWYPEEDSDEKDK